MEENKILVTGASGYVGSRLVPELLDAGYGVRAVSRSPEKLESYSWATNERVELQQADALDESSLREACQGCSAVYYLIHSMGQGSGDFEEADRRAAANMARSTEASEVDRIVYLGGIDPTDGDEELSKHRRSRLEVEKALDSGSVPVTVFRAAMVVGSGSASFEMLRYSLERLPGFIVTHSYADDPTQPIAVTNVLEYLVRCLDEDRTIGETYDIGGPDVLTNRDVMKTYCRVADLPDPTIISTELMPLTVVAWATSLLTPMPWALVEPLVFGARHPSVCQENRITEIIPQDLIHLEDAMQRANERTRLEVLDDDPSVLGSVPEWPRSGDPEWSGGVHYEDERSVTVDVSPDVVWRTIHELGARNGLFFAKWFRDFVGWVDSFIGLFDFPDESPEQPPREGSYLDCWVITEFEEPEHLQLTADVKLPGDATYDFYLRAEERGGTTIVQKARFRPRGLRGRLYWRVLSLFHVFSFPLGLRAIANQSERTAAGSPEEHDA